MCSLLEFQKPIPVTTIIGDAYAIYVKSNGMFEDDEWCCCLTESGQVRHFVSSQIKIWHNQTYQIKKAQNDQNNSK